MSFQTFFDTPSENRVEIIKNLISSIAEPGDNLSEEENQALQELRLKELVISKIYDAYMTEFEKHRQALPEGEREKFEVSSVFDEFDTEAFRILYDFRLLSQ